MHLERQRQSFFSHLRKAEPIEAAKAPKEEGLARQPNHGESILPVIEELADQRLALLEQLENLATAHARWQSEQNDLAGELATLAEKLGQQEEDLQHRQQASRRRGKTTTKCRTIETSAGRIGRPAQSSGDPGNGVEGRTTPHRLGTGIENGMAGSPGAIRDRAVSSLERPASRSYYSCAASTGGVWN